MVGKDKSLYENKHPNKSLKGTGHANKKSIRYINNV
jgi:hypothetical protein